jgi:hypothetical protein
MTTISFVTFVSVVLAIYNVGDVSGQGELHTTFCIGLYERERTLALVVRPRFLMRESTGPTHRSAKCRVQPLQQWLKYKIWGPGTVSSLGPQITAGALCQWLK